MAILNRIFPLVAVFMAGFLLALVATRHTAANLWPDIGIGALAAALFLAAVLFMGRRH